MKFNCFDFLLLLIYIQCSPLKLKETNVHGLVSWTDLGLSVFLATKDNQTEIYNDLSWVYGDLKRKDESFHIFQEWRNPDSQLPVRRLWYGPNQQKLIEWEDHNQNGIWDTKTFFNSYAKGKNLGNIVAFAEIDVDEDGKGDLRIYLGERVERISKVNGKIEMWSGKLDLVTPFLVDRNISHLGKSQWISVDSSWTYNPNLIPNKKFKSVFIEEP